VIDWYADRCEDFTRLVQSSIMLGKPIIVVHVPYRVGLCGYGLLPGGKGGGNNALFDQRNALEWIKRNISSFGGDAENITLGGESAGAFSVDAHLQAKEQVPYFRRAILMSGTLRVLQFHSVEKRIELTRNAAAAIGLDGEDWPERLMEVSTEEIIEAQTKSGVTTMHGIDDGEWLDGDVAQMKKVVVPEWVDSIMIGDCGFEVRSLLAISCVIHSADLIGRVSSGRRSTWISPWRRPSSFLRRRAK